MRSRVRCGDCGADRCRSRLNSAIRATSFNAASRSCDVSSNRSAPTSAQSISYPSETESTRSSISSGSAGMTHVLSQALQRPPHRHPRRIAARTIGHGGNLDVVEVELDPEVEQPLGIFRQLLERPLVAVEDVGPDRHLERRGQRILDRLWNLIRARPAPDPADLIPNTIEDRLPHVGLEAPWAPDLDPVESVHDPHEGFLD